MRWLRGGTPVGGHLPGELAASTGHVDQVSDGQTEVKSAPTGTVHTCGGAAQRKPSWSRATKAGS